MSDTTTTLNPGTGGDVLDESSVIQADGTTVAKRPRVEVALSEDGIPKLVGKDMPLPTTDSAALVLLEKIEAHLAAIREAVCGFIDE